VRDYGAKRVAGRAVRRRDGYDSVAHGAKLLAFFRSSQPRLPLCARSSGLSETVPAIAFHGGCRTKPSWRGRRPLAEVGASTAERRRVVSQAFSVTNDSPTFEARP
jgi:hypothetical protein